MVMSYHSKDEAYNNIPPVNGYKEQIQVVHETIALLCYSGLF